MSSKDEGAMLLWLVLVAILLPSSAGAQQVQQTGTQAKADTPALQERHPRYTLKSGDSFSLLFPFSPEFNQTLKVQPDGFVSLREVGDVYMAGLTLSQVKDLVAERYSAILYQPSVSVVPENLQEHYFIVAGEVSRPGKYDLRGEATVLQAIAMAGGFTQDRAKSSEVVLYHREGDHFANGRVIDMKKMTRHRDLREDALVKPGDLIYVPQNLWSKARQVIPIPGVGLTMMPAIP
jgi:polysaccharide export outer membrane protein